MSIDLEPEVVEEIENGRKIAAIRKLRESKGIGLKEARELVDAYCSENNISDRSVQRVKSGNGFVLFIILCIVCYFLYRYFWHSA